MTGSGSVSSFLNEVKSMQAFMRTTPFVFVAACFFFAGCEGGDQPGDLDLGMDTTTTEDMGADTLQMAFADLQPTEGNEVHGTVSFSEAPGGVRIVASITGLEEGQHGFHVHENGDCSAPDASSAGGHYAPDGSPHGAPTDPAGQRHAGDMGNLEADASGNASYERVDEVMTLSGPNSIVGKAVIVHANADDLESQPSGDAGNRLACGVIQEGSSEAGGMSGGTSNQMPGSTTDDMTDENASTDGMSDVLSDEEPDM